MTPRSDLNQLKGTDALHPLHDGFLPGPRLTLPGSGQGPLAGLSFAAKDLFDVAGAPTGASNPDWARSHPIPTAHGWMVQRLLDAGAALVGKTITCTIKMVNQPERHFHAVVRAFTRLGAYGRGVAAYRLEAVPRLWQVGRTADCRIFQDKSVKDIATLVLAHDTYHIAQLAQYTATP